MLTKNKYKMKLILFEIFLIICCDKNKYLAMFVMLLQIFLQCLIEFRGHFIFIITANKFQINVKQINNIKM